MQKRLILSTGISLVFVATQAFAAMSAPVGWYLDGNIGSTNVQGKSYPGDASVSGFGGGADLGYKYSPYLGVELGYTIYANSYITDPSTNLQAAFDRHYSYDLAMKAILPVQDTGFEFYGKLGVGQVRSSLGILNQTAANNLLMSGTDHVATGWFTAGGVQYFFVPQLGIGAGWSHANGNSSTGNVDLLSGGLTLIFG